MATKTGKDKYPWSDPKKAGLTGLIMAIVSFFIIPGMAIGAVVLGIFGIYFALKQKSGMNIILLNIAAIILGLASNILVNLIR